MQGYVTLSCDTNVAVRAVLSGCVVMVCGCCIVGPPCAAIYPACWTCPGTTPVTDSSCGWQYCTNFDVRKKPLCTPLIYESDAKLNSDLARFTRCRHTAESCLVETKLSLLLQDQCYNDTVWDAGGSFVRFSSGCRQSCVDDTDHSDQTGTQCDVAQRYCRAGCCISFFNFGFCL